MKTFIQISIIALMVLFVTVAPIAVYKHVNRAQQELVQQTVEEYDSTNVYNIFEPEQKYLDN